MFKDIRMQNNGEVCEVVVISSHVPVTQEKTITMVLFFHQQLVARLENLKTSVSEFCEQNMGLKDLPYSNDSF